MAGFFIFEAMSVTQLLEIHSRCSGVEIDSRKVKPGNLFVALKGEQADGNKFAQKALDAGAIAALVDDPALKDQPGMVWAEDALAALQQLATAYRKTFSFPVLALTGSNGKTTTKELLYAALSTKYRTYATKGNYNNHIGVPLTLLSVPKDAEFAIIEMGANHQGEIAMLSEIARPEYGFITNIGKAHLEGFGGLAGVKKGKSELYRFLMANSGTIFFNNANEVLEDVVAGYDKVIRFGIGTADGFSGEILPGDFARIKVGDTEIASSLVGSFNGQNILAALCIGDHFGCSLEAMASAIAAYLPDNNRSQWLEHNGNHYISDAYNANPSSMSAAIAHFASMPVQPKVLIIGDMMELGEEAAAEHAAILQQALRSDFQRIITVGTFFGAARGASPDHFDTTEALLEHIQEHPLQQQYILLKGSRKMGLERLLG